MFPRRSSNVWSFTAALVRRDDAHGKERQAQVDGRGIECVRGIVQVDGEALVDIETARNPDQGLDEVRIEAPVAYLVGVGQGIA